MAVVSALLSAVKGIRHGFGDRREPVPESLRELWESARPQWKQVHGIACAEVTRASQPCGEIDSLWTRASGVPIAIVTADCVPILLARRDGGAVAAIHAGWRGTRARILRALWNELAARGERPADWVAAIGPAIGPCCYEVSEELAADFEKEFAGMDGGPAVPRHRMLDLPAINRSELLAIGLREVDLIRACTRCSILASGTISGGDAEPAYHSYRREGGGTRQYSMILRS